MLARGTVKCCRLCRAQKELHHFNKDCTAADGLQTTCKQCFQSINRKHYSNPEVRVKYLKYAKLPEVIARQKKNRDKLENKVKRCARQRVYDSRLENRFRAWAGDLKRKYNITPEQYLELFNKQGGKCAICNQPNKNGKRLEVDHNHKTGKIRGLLCNKHNLALGIFMADHGPELLQRAIEYILKI